MKEKIYAYTHQPAFFKKLILMLVGVLCMGFFLSFLIEVDLGTDPCTFMNVAISKKFGILFGTWQLILNAALFIVVILFDIKKIGPGTLANMVFIGYISDFCRWMWSKILPREFFTTFPARGIIFAVAIVCFVIGASFYMNTDMGVSPYDPFPVIIHDRLLKNISFKYVRMGYDFLVIIIGCLFGGKPNIGIVVMALLLGPVITFVGKKLAPYLK